MTAPFGSAGTAGRNYRVELPAHSWQLGKYDYGRRATCAVCGRERHAHGSER